MTRESPNQSIVSFSAIPEGESGVCFVMLAEKVRGLTRENKPFYTCRFRDQRRIATCMIWADGDYFQECDLYWGAGSYYKIDATYHNHERYGPQIELHRIREVKEADKKDGFRPELLSDRSKYDSAEMLAELRAVAEKELQQAPVRELVSNILTKHSEAILQLPASPKHYYPFPGGWLEHTINVVRNVLWLGERYANLYPELKPPLNRDLLLAGAMLHECGRIRELLPQPPFERTTEGQLFSHHHLGRDLVMEEARAIDPFDREFLMLLEHMLMSYLVLPEWGSPRQPAIPEVYLLHYADDMDAKMEMVARCLTRDTSEGAFTDRDPILGRVLLKDRRQ